MADHYRVRDTALTFSPGTVSVIAGSTLSYRWARTGPADGTVAVGSSLLIAGSADVWSTGAFTELDYDDTDPPSLEGSTPLRSIKSFGAKFDNVTDDTTAWQAALDYEGPVLIDPGNSSVAGNLTWRSGSDLRGFGSGGPGVIPIAARRSVIRRANGSSGSLFTIPQGVGVGRLEGLEIDGRSQPGDLIHFDDYAPGDEAQLKFEDCYIHDAGMTAGFAGGDGVYFGVGRRNARFLRCFVYNNARHNVNIQGSDTHWTNCMVGASGYHGVLLNNSATRFIGGEIYAAGAGAAAQAAVNVSGVSIANPAVITTATAHGLVTGQTVNVASVGGATAVNARWTVTVLSTTTFSVPVSNSNAFTTGGTVQQTGYAVYVPGAAAGSQLISVGIDRNQFAGVMLDLASTFLAIIGCQFLSNSQFANSGYGHIENNSGGAGHIIVGNTFEAPATGYSTNKADYCVRTQNSSKWADAGNRMTSTSVATNQYTNYASGAQMSAQGRMNVLTGSDAFTALAVARNSATQTGDTLQGQDQSGNALGFAMDRANRPRAAGTAPAAAVGAGAGTGGSVAASVVGSDMAGTITVVTGTAGVAAGVLTALTFSVSYANANVRITLTPSNAAAAGLTVPYVTAKATSGFSLAVVAAPATGTTYTWDYQVVGG